MARTAQRGRELPWSRSLPRSIPSTGPRRQPHRPSARPHRRLTPLTPRSTATADQTRTGDKIVALNVPWRRPARHPTGTRGGNCSRAPPDSAPPSPAAPPIARQRLIPVPQRQQPCYLLPELPPLCQRNEQVIEPNRVLLQLAQRRPGRRVITYPRAGHTTTPRPIANPRQSQPTTPRITAYPGGDRPGGHPRAPPTRRPVPWS